MNKEKLTAGGDIVLRYLEDLILNKLNNLNIWLYLHCPPAYYIFDKIFDASIKNRRIAK